MIFKKTFPAVCALLLALAGCSSPSHEDTAAEVQTGSAAAAAPSASAHRKSESLDTAGAMGGISMDEAKMKMATNEQVPVKEKAAPRKIIFTGVVLVDCDNLDRTSAKLEAMVRAFNGYVGNAAMDMEKGDARTSTWTLRVPSSQFSACMKAAEGLGELRKSTRTGQDVSEEFYDSQARLKNKRVEEARLIELLKNATGKLSEILTVENEIARVREEIEVIEGRLHYLSNMTDLSTITVTAREVKTFAPVTEPTLGTKVGRSFATSLTGLGETATAVLLATVAFLPWAVPLLLLLWLGWKIVGRRVRTALLPPPATPIS